MKYEIYYDNLNMQCPDKNIIGAPKIRNNFGAITSIKFPILHKQYLTFSIAPCKVIALDLFYLIFGNSSVLLS